MILNTDSFTHSDFKDLLSSAEVNTYLEIAKHMTEDNLVYLYQKSQRKPAIIDQVADRLGITKGTVQDRISSIIGKQDDMRYFMYKVDAGIKGEYFLSPHLVLRYGDCYDRIFDIVLPSMEDYALGKGYTV